MGRKKDKGLTKEEQTQTRIAIVSPDKCKPKKCRLECKKICPVVRMGNLCIEVTESSKVAFLSETLCIGCGFCVKKCPFEAITIINLPKNLECQTSHRYGPNSFKLHRLPNPKVGKVLGLVGTNGIGKSTALKILAGKQKPNLGNFNDPPSWEDVLKYFRGSELQSYFKKIVENDLKAVIKPQYVDHIPRAVKGVVKDIIIAKDERKKKKGMVKKLELVKVLGRDLNKLSGGELQRFALCIVAIRKADVYMFDEPSSYLDVRQRLKAARVIRSMVSEKTYVIVVEHDLSILDYLSDVVCVLYGTPGAFGVISMPFGVREGINIFLDGYLPTENLRFREVSLTFRVSQVDDNAEEVRSRNKYKYPKMSLTFKKNDKKQFKLNVEPGTFQDSEIVVLLGENGTGKTSLIRLLAGKEKPDDESTYLPELNISFKPQKISPKFPGTVAQLLYKRIKSAMAHPQFQTDVFKPMNIKPLMDQKVQHLSGGELQRVALVLCLGTPADVYLIDEPSAYLDSEQRLIACKVIKRFILHAKKTAFIVEHDFIMATYLADRVIVYEGTPSVECTAGALQGLLSGMNKFLKMLDVTYRRDPTNFRPRINKYGSVMDRQQKAQGNYFFLDAGDDDEEASDNLRGTTKTGGKATRPEKKLNLKEKRDLEKGVSEKKDEKKDEKKEEKKVEKKVEKKAEKKVEKKTEKNEKKVEKKKK